MPLNFSRKICVMPDIYNLSQIQVSHFRVSGIMLKADCKGKQRTIILTTFSDRPSKRMVSKKKSGALKNILL